MICRHMQREEEEEKGLGKFEKILEKELVGGKSLVLKGSNMVPKMVTPTPHQSVQPIQKKGETKMKRKVLTKEQVYQNKKDYIRRYVKEKTFVLQIGLHKEKDADIIEYLNTISIGSKRDYIRNLIRADMSKK